MTKTKKLSVIPCQKCKREFDRGQNFNTAMCMRCIVEKKKFKKLKKQYKPNGNTRTIERACVSCNGIIKRDVPRKQVKHLMSIKIICEGCFNKRIERKRHGKKKNT